MYHVEIGATIGNYKVYLNFLFFYLHGSLH